MSYIGSTPTSGDFVLLDNLTASATASYTMQRNSVNFEPQSANHMIVSLNGTIQKPGSSFTISGSTITFASALTSSDAIDFILVLGNVNDVGVATSVVDSAITKGKLDLISTSGSPGLTVKGDGSSENGTIQLNCSQNSHGVKISSPAHSSGQSYELILPTGNVTADKFLKVASVSGSGTTGIGQLSFGDAGGTNTPNFRASLSSSPTLGTGAEVYVTMDNEIFDSDSAYDPSTGRFTVPSGKAGVYFFQAQIKSVSSADFNMFEVQIHQNTGSIAEARHYHDHENTVSVSVLVNASVGDYFRVRAFQNAGSDKTLAENSRFTFFQGFKLA